MADRWWDEFHPAYARELSRQVEGVTLDIGDAEQGIEEKTATVDRLTGVIVGIDSTGIFAGLNVVDTVGYQWTLYSDGTISDSDDRTVGRHTLKTMPAPKTVVEL